jgi:hypothetical protein
MALMRRVAARLGRDAPVGVRVAGPGAAVSTFLPVGQQAVVPRGGGGQGGAQLPQVWDERTETAV